jgi:hypothetical protein
MREPEYVGVFPLGHEVSKEEYQLQLIVSTFNNFIDYNVTDTAFLGNTIFGLTSSGLALDGITQFRSHLGTCSASTGRPTIAYAVNINQ